MLRQEKIGQLKKDLIKKYFYIMFGVLFSYSIYFTFVLKSTFMQLYVLAGLALLSFVWFTFTDRIEIEKFIRGYLVVAPLYCFTVILFFWKYTVTNFVWLIPIPIGAYIFFSSKEVIAYSIYALFIIVMACLVGEIISVPLIKANLYQIKISDIFLFGSNIIISGYLLSYKDKIRSLQIITNIEKQEKIEMPVTLDEKELEKHRNLFLKIDHLMVERQLFKDPNFNIASMSEILRASTSYTSRAIRYSEYSNFNDYVNFYRIGHFISLIHTRDLEKVTLVALSTEAGFRNQSTFNKAFKKFRNVTPSEYVAALRTSSKISDN